MRNSLINRRNLLKLTGTGVAGATIGANPVSAQSLDFDIEYYLNYWGSSSSNDAVIHSQGIVFKTIGEIEFGPDTIVRIQNTETDREIEATPESSRAVSDDTQISCWDLYDHGELVEDPMISVLEDDWIDIDVSVEGDSDVFTSGSIFSTYQVKIIDADAGEPIASTVETPIGIGFERPSIQQDGTTGEIDLSVELPESLDESWYPEFSTHISDDGFWFQDTAIDNPGTDTLEWTVDFSGSRPGTYDGWNIRIYPDEDAPGSRSVMTFSGFLEGDEIVIEEATDDPTEIEDWHDLDAMRSDVSDDYILVNDLDEDTPGYDEVAGPDANDGLGFEPVGTEDAPFVGSFDGQDNEIQGLHIGRPTENAVGLFGIISGARTELAVQALHLAVGTIEGSGDSSGGGVGTIAGGVFGLRTIADVSVIGDQVTATDRYAGGLIGSCWEGDDVVIEDSSANIPVHQIGGDGRAGGLIGGAQSVHVENCSAAGIVDANGDRIGGLIGNAGNDLTVLNSEVSGNVKTSGESEEANGDRVGGLVGYLQSGSKVIDSHASGDVTGIDSVGGLIGLTSFDSPTLVQNCFAEGSVTSTEEDDFAKVGGLIGQNQGEVIDSYAVGDVTGNSGGAKGDYVGGLIGDDYGDIRRCFAAGTVRGESMVGGLVGSNDLVDGSTLDGSIKNCYATGSVQASETSNSIGGLVGRNWRSIENSFATGTVSGGGDVGGIIGYIGEDATVIDSYWDTESTTQPTALGAGDGDVDATGLTTVEMQGSTAEENMSTLDFEETWTVVTDPNNYPVLRWQDEVEAPDEEEVTGDTTIKLDTVGSSAWRVTDIDGDGIEAPLDEDNPELTLEVGLRYVIENTDWSAHPVEFRDTAAEPLLSQDRSGSFENDSAVDWVDSDEEVAFRLTEELAAEIDSYICTNHSSMVGDVELSDADDEQHESGVSQELFDAVDEEGDGGLSLAELRDAVGQWGDNEQVNDVEISLNDLRNLVDYWQQT